MSDNVIDATALFAGRKPESVSTEFWEWGQDFIAEGVLELDNLVTDLKNCTSEQELCAHIVALRHMVAEFPECVPYPQDGL